MKNNSIDIVLLWVDGNDPLWQKEKRKYSLQDNPDQLVDDSIQRYRDWDNLQYVFRGIEKFAPWVRKIHFVTWGHVPNWLNLDNKKLNFVKHEDFIPVEFLPTFNSSVIEINLHRIKGLSDKFIYFNDDMFITKPMKESDFFENGLPCDQAHLGSVITNGYSDIFAHHLLNNIAVINHNFNLKTCVRTNVRGWYSLSYPIPTLVRNIYALTYNNFTGMHCEHMPSPFLKDTYKAVWDTEKAILEETSSHKFRHIQDVNQYLFKGWQFATGKFYPKNIHKISKYYQNPNIQEHVIFEAIRKQKYKMVCVNDSGEINFEELKIGINQSLETLMPEKSTFEK